MKSLGGTTITEIGSGSVAIVQLVYLEFSTPIGLNTSTWNLDFGGVTYQGAKGLGTISTITDQPGQVQGISLELFCDASTVSLALDGSDVVQGTPCIIRTAIIETTNYTVLDAPIVWSGFLDTMSISEDGQTASVKVTAESGAVALLKGNPITYSDSAQVAINATDRCFKYVVDQMLKPIVWPAKSFFTK